MRSAFIVSFIAISTLLVSCSGNDKKMPGSSTNDNAVNNQIGKKEYSGDSMLESVKPFLNNELADWSKSFAGFSIDSFRMTQRSEFDTTKANFYGENMPNFFELYESSLCYSPDSSHFIDLYSSGVMLEKKGKRIIASADADQAVTLCNLKTREWNSIAFFGSSASIEEVAWTSPSDFFLAGSMYNEGGEQTPYIMLGDINSKTFRWFEANTKRPETSKYQPGRLKKLKIDEWE